MGSTLSGIKFLENEKKSIFTELMMSTQWMDICVGVIGARFNVADKDTSETLKNVLLSKTSMDAKWLSFLYLADFYKTSLFEFVDFSLTGLTESGWGLCEIWDRCINPDNGEDKLEKTEQLFNLCATAEQKQTLITHIFLLDEKGTYLSLTSKYNSYEKDIVYDPNLVRFSRSRQRGLLLSTGVSKWTYSKLFGVWRGQIQNSLANIVKDLSLTKVKALLHKCKDIPSVSLRMAVFQGLDFFLGSSEEYHNELQWGLSDPHPWVRRTALEFFINRQQEKSIEQLSKSLFSTNRDFYPGMLDLIHSSQKIASFWALPDEQYHEIVKTLLDDLSHSDIEALEWAAKNDLLPLSRLTRT